MSLIIVLRNISALAPISDYEYRVMAGDGGPLSKVLKRGTVKKHIREQGWEALVRLMLEDNCKCYTKEICPLHIEGCDI